MKKIILMCSMATMIFASTDIYDFDNSKYIQTEKEYYLKKADENKQKEACINAAKEVRMMKSCFKKR